MADGGVVVLDGSHIRNALPNLERRLEARHLGEKVSGPEFIALAEAEASAILFDLGLPENLRALVLERTQFTDIDSLQFDRETVLRKLHDYLLALADELKGTEKFRPNLGFFCWSDISQFMIGSV